MTRRARRPKRRRPVRPGRWPGGLEDRGGITGLVREVAGHPETGPALSGGDVDADWLRAHLSGEEAVGGSVATPDQDVVDEIGHALGVEQASEDQVRTSEEILRNRDRFRWHLEREAADSEEGRPPRPRRGTR